MRLALTLSFFILAFSGLMAQFVQVAQGAGYAESIYFDLATRNATAVSHTSWDIAFNVAGRSSGILVNEGIASSRTTPLRHVELYASTSTDFSTADTTMITDRIHNGESSWDDGAFNQPATVGDPFDLGWGSYSPSTQAVLGSRVFYVVTRDGIYHKVLIESLAGGAYTFIHSVEGSAETETVTINKADFTGKTLAYFSFEDGVLDLEPTSWDLLFTRYITPLPDDDGNILDYTVTGVIQNKGVTVAEVSGIDPQSAVAPSNKDAYSDTLTTIGFDWKSFDLDLFTWSIPDDLVYFVETPDSIYRMQLIDFEGSSTGVSTFTLSGEEKTTATTIVPSGINSSRLYPNPASEIVTLEIESKYAANNLQLDVLDATGRTLHRTSVSALLPGVNRIEVPLRQLATGHYFVRLTGTTGVLIHHLIKQ